MQLFEDHAWERKPRDVTFELIGGRVFLPQSIRV
jgi:hypothetical protein